MAQFIPRNKQTAKRRKKQDSGKYGSRVLG
jgi:hypothetical protein